MKTSKNNINEKKLSKAELNRREEIIKDLKGNKREFVKRYGKDAEKVMYARATNIAKKQAEAMNPESANRIKEAIKLALMGPVSEQQPSTDKYDDNPALKGKQSELPDALQKAIIKKAGGKVQEDDRVDYTFFAKRVLEDLMKNGLDKEDIRRVMFQMEFIMQKPDMFTEGDLDVGHQDDEPNMIRANLYQLATYSAELMHMMKKYDDMAGEVDFPHWWQAKITKALDYMEKAKHYLENKEALAKIDSMTDRVMENVLKKLQ